MSVCVSVVLLSLPLLVSAELAPRWGAAAVLVLAVALRLPFLLRPPELSDDIYRYLWDGHAVVSGQNPYADSPQDLVPAEADLQALRGQVNHPELVTIYPPFAQLVFAAGWAFPGGVLGMKSLLCVLDLLTCAALIWTLRSLGLPAWRSALYAWHPLPVLEIAGSGHIDGAGVCFLVISLALLVSRTHRVRDPLVAGIAFGASVCTKLFPIALLPVALALAGRRRWVPLLAATVATGVLCTVLFLPDIRNALETFSAYADRWEFASFTFHCLRGLTGSGDLARRLLIAAFVVSCALLVAPLWRRRAERDPMRALRAGYGVALAFLLLTPTLHAWYALYLAAMLPFAAGPAGLALSASVFLGYRVLARFVREGQWVDSTGVAALIFAAPVAAALAGIAIRTLRGKGSNAIGSSRRAE